MPFKRGYDPNRKDPREAAKFAGRPKIEFLERIRKLSPIAEEILREALKSKSRSVRLRAMQEVFDRGWGRPKQTTELTGEDGNPIEFVVPDPKFKV